MSLINPEHLSPPSEKYAENFFKYFTTTKRRKLAYGNNIYTQSLIENYKIDGIVDDFTNKDSTLPIYKTDDISEEDIVIVCSGGNILTACNNVKAKRARFIDYFHFSYYSPAKLVPMYFNEGFRDAFHENFSKFNYVYELLADEESKSIFNQLISFRYTENVNYLEGFQDMQDVQYFEDFVKLDSGGGGKLSGILEPLTGKTHNNLFQDARITVL
jgi:hypothetical protein